MTKPKVIMVVNDDLDILMVIETILQEEGYRVVREDETIVDPQKVLRVKPDLLIVGQRVEGNYSDWQLVQHLSLTRATATIPILICTTKEWLVQAQYDGFKTKHLSFLLKPFDLDDLISLVGEMLTNAEVVEEASA